MEGGEIMAGNFEGIKNRRFGIEIEMTGITRCSAAKAGSWSSVELPISSPTKMQKSLFCCGSWIREISQDLTTMKDSRTAATKKMWSLS